MRSSRFAILCAILAISLPSLAQAGKTKKGKEPPKPAVTKVDPEAIKELMGPFKWGMSPDEVLVVVETQITERNADAFKAATDAAEREGVKKKSKAELGKVKGSLTKFDGKPGGWDVSIIEGEFGQKNDEEMLVYNDLDRGQQRYFFFLDGKLWKMFIAVNMEGFQGKKFMDFAGFMEARYGQAKVHTKPNAEGIEEIDYIWWRTADIFLRAIDLNRFYGAFCLAISDQKTEEYIYARREERNPTPGKRTTVVDSVTEDKTKPIDSKADPNRNVIDDITGGK
jgi:hypothetical protein